MKKNVCIVLISVLTLWAVTTTLTGKCVGVSDGDTIKVVVDGEQKKIRLYGIDCPESAQPWGKVAKKYASDFCYGKEVRLEVHDTDRYGRLVAEVFVEDESLNKSLVGSGLAWWYQRYAPEDSILESLEIMAKKQKKGLWGEKEFKIIAPWEWRKMGKEERDLHR